MTQNVKDDTPTVTGQWVEQAAWMVVAPEGRYAFPTNLEKALTDDEKARGWSKIPLYVHPTPTDDLLSDLVEAAAHVIAGSAKVDETDPEYVVHAPYLDRLRAALAKVRPDV